MLYNIIEDISTITTIPLKTLYKLADKAGDCLCNNVLESKNMDDNTSTMDIGIGKIIVNITPQNITYTFSPSKELEVKMVEAIKTNNSPLVENIETNLAAKILNTYKDLIWVKI